jgi:NADH-quinone oxidoreductase subunit H
MRFALFFLAEYAGMITTSAVCVALFFGGWHLPWLEWAWPALRGDVDPANPALTTSIWAALARSGIFFIKTLAIIFVFMWVRWSLPRFRFDQIMMLAWRGLIPVSLALMMVTAVVVYLTRNMPHAHDRISGRAAVIFLIANALLVAGTFVVSLLLPPAPETNRRVGVPNSRFRRTPLPGGRVGEPAVNQAARAAVPVSAVPAAAGRVGT